MLTLQECLTAVSPALLSAMRIVSPIYGTRCSTVLAQRRDGRVQFAERWFTPEGEATDTLRYEFDLLD